MTVEEQPTVLGEAQKPSTTDTPATDKQPAATQIPDGKTPASEAPAPAQAPDKPADGEQKASGPPRGPDGKFLPRSTEEKQGEDVPADAYDLIIPTDVPVEARALSDFKQVAGELNLPKEAAQRLFDMHVALQRAGYDAWSAQNRSWLEEIRNDREFGHDNYDRTKLTASRFIDRFGSAKLREVLNETGLGNNPELIRAFARAGKELASEDTFVGGARPATIRDGRALQPNLPDLNP